MNKTDIIGILSPLYLIFKIISTGINREYLRQYFKSTTWFKYMKSVANYGARHDRMSITDEDFFNMPINIPNLANKPPLLMFLPRQIRKLNF